MGTQGMVGWIMEVYRQVGVWNEVYGWTSGGISGFVNE